jgi:hypothetical protein
LIKINFLCENKEKLGKDSSVSKVTNCWLHDQGLILDRVRPPYQNNTGAYRASYLMATAGFFPWVKRLEHEDNH